jgi:hypothetical protein
MRRNTFLVGMMVVVLGALTVACAKPPQQELDGAKAAMASAQQAEAPKYAADAWDKAQQSMNAVNAEIEAQNAKFALFRSYTKAKQLIADATNAANAAKDAAVAGKEKAKNEARAAIDAVKTAIDTAKATMTALEKCRRKPKDLRKDLQLMKGNLDGYANQAAELETAFGKEDYFGAKAQAESLKGQVDNMNNELQAAKAKIKC